MPDLGKYADAVLSAYAVSILALIILVVLSMRRARKMRRAVEMAEARRNAGKQPQ